MAMLTCHCPVSLSNATRFPSNSLSLVSARRSTPFPAKFSSRFHRNAKLDLADFIHISDLNKATMCKILDHASKVTLLLRLGKRAFIPYKEKEMPLVSIEQSMINWFLSGTRYFFSCRHSMCLKPNDTQVAKWKQTQSIAQMLSNYNGIISEHLFAHQRMDLLSFPMECFLVATALMLIMPCEALAETCKADNTSMFSMPFLFAIALIGAAVGGLLARQRKGELKRLNDQLRQINEALRRQAKIESYAPNLSYAPVGRVLEKEIIVDPRKQQLISNLKTGKNYLRNQEQEKSFFEFKAALELAQSLGDPINEKKAARGLGASLQRQGKYREAIKYHSMVLAISEREEEYSGDTEAFGAIADCYTELGDLERAGKFYDKYIARLEKD